MSLETNQVNCLLTKFSSPPHQGTSARLTQILEQILTPKPLTISLESFMLRYIPLSARIAKNKKNTFNFLDIPSITSEAASNLDTPFTINELRSALMLMQNGKCPEPDGFPAEFFKTFADTLSPLLLNMNHCREAHSLSRCVRLLSLLY